MKVDTKLVFSYPNEPQTDFRVKKITEYYDGGKTISYQPCVEGYIGYESVQEAIDYYAKMLESYADYLTEQKVTEVPRDKDCLYKTRDIEISKISNDKDTLFVFTNAPQMSNRWDCYYWLEDVIEQLKQFHI